MKAFAPIVLAATVALSGCGLKTYSSGVMPLGPDTYTVSADDLNPSNAKQAALTQASQYCANKDQELLVNHIVDGSRGNRMYYDINFRCLGKNDPELKRPSFTKSPDIVIEERK